MSIQVYDENATLVAIGSGFVYSNGYVVTNEHVTSAGSSYVLVFLDSSEVRATLKADDSEGDIAVLSANFPPYAKPLEMGDSNRLHVGESAFAMGSPDGFDGSFSEGIVSQVNRTVPDYSSFFYIQTDAAINPGSSGGPLLNSDGKVIGIDTFGVVGGEGLGFAIPSSILKRVVPSLIQTGNYSYPSLGVFGTFLDPISAQNSHIPVTSGWLVQLVLPGTGASPSLREGDVVLAINNYSILHDHDVPYILYTFFSPGDRVTLKVFRNGQTLDINFTLGTM